MMAAQPYNFADDEAAMFSAALKNISSGMASEAQTAQFIASVKNAIHLLEDPWENSDKATSLEVTLSLILRIENELYREISDNNLKDHNSEVAKKLMPLVEKYFEAGI